ncbi:AraC family transcriptional regulator [Chitinophaga sp.]|uniref:helix-turn-helix domain-containing protein n=1 Tax=Chitinophaga sp. TaxID=1869181 RepID=UPI0031D63B9B
MLEKDRILVSCYHHVSREGENFIGEHSLGYVVSGTQEVFLDGTHYVFKEGDFRFFARNQLAKFVKIPPVGGGDFKTVGIRIDQELLHSLSQETGLKAEGIFRGEKNFHLPEHQLLTHYRDSLQPYIDGQGVHNPVLTMMKVKEAALLLLQLKPELKNLLFDFSTPGKIDLEAYMNEHYKFNVDISRFAYLTGRSLATFKRDFEKVFHTTPGKWLQQKRLEDAYYLIKEKGWKSTDVYLEVGFKDLSHFSFVFKKVYGVAPSRVRA